MTLLARRSAHRSDWDLDVLTLRWPHLDRPEIPALGCFETHYRVKVSTVGEDGDLIALGHVGKLRALAAFQAYTRVMFGIRGLYGEHFSTPERAVDDVEHLWMTNDSGDLEEWYMRRADGPQVQGAFPVTYWSA